MNKFLKIGLVLAGYVVAFAAAYGISYVRERAMQIEDPVQSSGGMQAFGDMIFFLGLFGALSLIPTALGLFFLRPFQKFWTGLSTVALPIAATAPVAVMMYPVLNSHYAPGFLRLFGFFALMKIMSTPVFAFGFLITACISPPQPKRWMLFTATALEGAVCVCALVFLFVVVYVLH